MGKEQKLPGEDSNPYNQDQNLTSCPLDDPGWSKTGGKDAARVAAYTLPVGRWILIAHSFHDPLDPPVEPTAAHHVDTSQATAVDRQDTIFRVVVGRLMPL